MRDAQGRDRANVVFGAAGMGAFASAPNNSSNLCYPVKWGEQTSPAFLLSTTFPHPRQRFQNNPGNWRNNPQPLPPIAQLNPQPLPPVAEQALQARGPASSRSVTVSIPGKVAGDINALTKATEVVLGKLGCGMCCSGFDILFKRELDLLVVDDRLNVQGFGQFR